MSKQINTKIVITELHRAFKMFNENLFGGALPEPAILIQSRGNKKLTLGWCSIKKIWKNEITEEEKYEINIVAEALNRGIYPVMTTLLHEMVHLYNLVNNIKDTSRGNTYHNMKFKKTAEAHGLLVEHADKIGWSVSKLQSLTMDLIDSFAFDEAVFSLGRRDLDFEGEGKPRKKKKTSSRKYICPECGTSIRASKDVNILCAECTKPEENKFVMFYKEPTEEDFDDNDNEGTEENNMVECVCLDCGCVHELPEGETVCPDCGGELEQVGTDPVAEPEEPVETPTGIVEVDTELLDGDGNKIPVKQGMIDVPVTKVWEESNIKEVLEVFSHEISKAGLKEVSIEDLTVEISDKMKSQWALYKEGKKITFSKDYLETTSEAEVLDTIKHEFLHHYQFVSEGIKVNHKKEFKALCEQFGLSLEVPTKNHRAMK